ncbi:MFS transporter [Deinococcus koreensis]|uniref:MFS transporter n=1 Tax=Deinococcus koreensis TaxID=2054903 RepID=A0A2K3UZ30_9DEIO|nr:MFS transporter [Deinococcus koreensis]PNY81788.1 MFS transporter [Deinococcus koreensis]
MLWLRPLTMLRLLALLALSEAVRTALFVSVLPLAGPALNLGPALIGALAGTHYLADALAKGPSGLITERWGLGRTLPVITGLGLAATLTLRFYPHPVAALLACAVWGLASAALWPGIMSASQALAQPGRTARALAISNLSVAPAILLGALGIGPLMQYSAELAWNSLLLMQGLAAALALSLWRLRTPRPGTRLVWTAWAPVAALLPAALAQTLAPGLLVTLLYPLLERLNLSLRDLILPGLLALGLFALSLWLIGRRADRDHPRRALRPGLLLLAATFALAALPEPQRFLWLLATLLGLGYGAFLTGWNGLVARTLPEGQRAAAWGTVMAVEALGYAIGPVLGGAVWQVWGAGGVFTLGAVIFLGALGYDLWRHRPGPERRTA